MTDQNRGRRRKVLVAMERSKHSQDAFKVYMQHIYKEGDVTIIAHVPESSRLVPIRCWGIGDCWMHLTKIGKASDNKT